MADSDPGTTLTHMTTTGRQFDALRAAFQPVGQPREEQVDAAGAAIGSTMKTDRIVFLVVSLSALLISIMIAPRLGRATSAPILGIADVAAKADLRRIVSAIAARNQTGDPFINGVRTV